MSASQSSWITLQFPNPFSLLRSTETKESEEKDVEIIKYNNEFSEIYHQFVNDLSYFRDKYPLTTLISMVFFAILGISSFFNFNFTGIITSVIFCTTSYCLGKSIGNKGSAFGTELKNSFFEVFQATGRKAPEKKEPEAEKA